MKKIEAVIQPHKLDEVKDALIGIGVDGMTISEVRGQEYKVDLLPKVKVEMVVPAERVDQIVGVLCTAARSGKIGDGKIFVSSMEDAVRIRNGERGELAL
jgi:nitrogen regulatory protein P-II 1